MQGSVAWAVLVLPSYVCKLQRTLFAGHLWKQARRVRSPLGSRLLWALFRLGCLKFSEHAERSDLGQRCGPEGSLGEDIRAFCRYSAKHMRNVLNRFQYQNTNGFLSELSCGFTVEGCNGDGFGVAC